MSSEERKNPDGNNPVSERLCNARTEILEEKFNGLKKSIYVAFAVSMAWITILELILVYMGAR